VNKLTQIIIRIICRLIKLDNISYTHIVYRQDIINIGTKYGGWSVPEDIFDMSSVCYCVGCGEDISFDLGMIEKFGSTIFAYDPTPRAISFVKEKTEDIDLYHFFSIGLWDSDCRIQLFEPMNPEHVSHSALNLQGTKAYIEVDVMRLRNIMSDNNHESIDLLKIDIEGAEYKVINSIIEDRLSIKVLCIEFDEWNNPLDVYYKKRISKSIKSLIEYGYEIIDCDFKGNYTFIRQKS